MAGNDSPSFEEIGTLTSDELFEGCGQFHALEIASHRKLLMFLAVIDEQERWREDFCHSMVEWVVARLS